MLNLFTLPSSLIVSDACRQRSINSKLGGMLNEIEMEAFLSSGSNDGEVLIGEIGLLNPFFVI